MEQLRTIEPVRVAELRVSRPLDLLLTTAQLACEQRGAADFGDARQHREPSCASAAPRQKLLRPSRTGTGQQIVQELQNHVGQDKEGIVKNFLDTLAQNNRLGVLEGVVNNFGVLMGAHRGEIELVVTSAAVR